MIDCTICLDSKENYKTLRCGHQFCNECINQLIEHNTFKNCPICRTSIIPPTKNILINNFIVPEDDNEDNEVRNHHNSSEIISEINSETDTEDYDHIQNVIAHSNYQRRLRNRHQINNYDLSRDRECCFSVVFAFFGLICVIIIVFIQLGIIE